jgi:MFS superfamily sulfate permease-like transporter
MQNTDKIVDFITISNWLLLFLSGMTALMMTQTQFACGIIFGGLIAAVNFHLLKKAIKNAFNPKAASKSNKLMIGTSLFKYYIRFAISGLLIYLLISKHIVNPLALLAGLSVVVVSMFLATAHELTKLFFKEAV